MDYDFVPNLTFGAKILQDIAASYNFKFDLHFMVKVKTKRFEDFFQEYLKIRPAMMTMHLEALSDQEAQKFIQLCHKNQVLASLAIKPETPVVNLKPYLTDLDNVLVMTVNPGFGGQSFLGDAALKIGELKNLLTKNQAYHYTVEVDGGINDQTVEQVKKQDVDLIVAGSYLFGHADFVERVGILNHE
jgi:ribulose-phosphate 3-epimerase